LPVRHVAVGILFDLFSSGPCVWQGVVRLLAQAQDLAPDVDIDGLTLRRPEADES
jgi:hypothetical protein